LQGIMQAFFWLYKFIIWSIIYNVCVGVAVCYKISEEMRNEYAL